MSDDQRADAFLAKAAESLAGAESECAMGRFNNCANRAYYACFQAAIAALLRAGYGPSGSDGEWRHAAVQALFSQQLVNRRKTYPAALQMVLERGALIRATADYQETSVGRREVVRWLRRSREFVEAVRQRGGSQQR
ncbi:MAG: HEPN domain-containing protein [Chloroflexia bacterium]|nr:HEPN domain-containing protein [Chloroflexia bacterium]